MTTRRPATVDRDIPLYLIAFNIQREVRVHGEELERVIVRKTGSHFYNISVRTKAINRELKRKSVKTYREVMAREQEEGELE